MKVQVFLALFLVLFSAFAVSNTDMVLTNSDDTGESNPNVTSVGTVTTVNNDNSSVGEPELTSEEGGEPAGDGVVGEVTSAVTTKVPSVECYKRRVELQNKIRGLKLLIQKAEETGELQTLEGARMKIIEVDKELQTLGECVPTLSEEKKQILVGQLEQYLQKVRDMELRIRLVNPCSKVEALDTKISELKLSVDGLSEDEVSVIEQKISVFSDAREVMNRACLALKSNPDCVNAIEVAKEVEALRGKIANKDVSELQARNSVANLVNRYRKLEGSCLVQINKMMENHPCISAQVLGVELQKFADSDDSKIVSEVYRKIDYYKNKCVNLQTVEDVASQINDKVRENTQESRSEVSQFIGELEIKKQMILAEDTLSGGEKQKMLSEIETEKKKAIRQIILNKGVMRISNSMRVKLAPKVMEVEGERMFNDNVTLQVSTSTGDDMNIEVSNDEVKLGRGKVNVRAKLAIDFENGVLFVGGKRIKLPDEIMSKINADEADLELNTDDDGNTVYEGNVRKQYKLFAIVPIRANVFVRTNAETGDVLKENAPWWAVFASK